MDNKMFLNQMKNTYDSLKYFSIEENSLILNLNGTFKIPFTNVNFINLNQNLFLLDPKEIFNILYMLQLLPKGEISELEKAFINQYVVRYLKLNDMALTKSNIDTNLIWGLSIPIYSSYNPECIENPCCQIIQNILNNHNDELLNNSEKGKHPRLVLTNPNFAQHYEEDNLINFEKAGFATLLLIGTTVAATFAYITYFIIGN